MRCASRDPRYLSFSRIAADVDRPYGGRRGVLVMAAAVVVDEKGF